MLRFFLAFYLALTFTASSFAQCPWSFGVEIQLGANGDHVREYAEYFNHNGSYGFHEEYNSWSPAVGGGLWAQRRLGLFASVQFGFHYLHQEYNLFMHHENHLPGARPAYYAHQQEQVVQQALLLPLEFRLYLRKPHRRMRPFLGGQVALGYLLSGQVVRTQAFADLSTELFHTVESISLNSSLDYIDSSLWQGLFGTQLGVQVAPFTFSIWHQRNFRRLHDNYYYPCEFGNCYASYVPANYHRILLHTQLKIAYQLK